MVLAWAAYWGWLREAGAFSALLLEPTLSRPFVFFITGVAIVEMVIDKVPKTPSRLTVWPLIARIVLGGFSAALLAEAGGLSALLGALLGAAAAVAGAYAGNRVRALLVRALKVPDFSVGLVEDAVAIGLGFLVASRFA
ncbi:MAG: hypothetical protein AABO41_24190 [Acidobacteriota bacterium]